MKKKLIFEIAIISFRMNYLMNRVLSKSVFILTYECGTLYEKMKTTRRLRDQLIYTEKTVLSNQQKYLVSI